MKNHIYEDRLKNHLVESGNVKMGVLRDCSESIINAARVIADSFKSGGKVLLCGNGGSAADCQHMAAELVCRLSKDFERPGLPALSLTTDTSFLTAYSNDYGFESAFERQVRTLGKAGDVLVAISTSGLSKNVINAVRAASSMSMQIIVLTGMKGELLKVSDVVVTVPSDNTQHIQESHLTVEHIICDLVEQSMFSE